MSLVDAIPTTERHKLRTEVGLFQFRMIQAVQTLRQKLADPTPHQLPSPLWLTKYGAQALPPRETPHTLRNHRGAPMRSGTKRKCRTEVETAEPIDPDQLICDARAENDNDAVAWLTRVQASDTAQEQTQKRRRISVAAERWEQYKKTANRCAQEHGQQSHDTYLSKHAAEVTRRHTARVLHQHTNRQNRLSHAGDQIDHRADGSTTTAQHTYPHVPGTKTMVRAGEIRHSDVLCGHENVAANLQAIREDVR